MNIRVLAMALAAITTAGCSSQSAVLTNDTGQSVKCENWGFGIIGAPVAMASQSDCVKKANEAGYHVGGKPAPGTAPSASAVKVSSRAAGQLGLAFPEGWQTKPVSDAMRQKGIAIYAANSTTDSQVFVTAADLQGITSQYDFVLSRRSGIESRLTDASHSDIADVTVNGRPAKQFQVTGISSDGPRLTYVTTFIFGQAQVVGVTAWTTAPNFDNQRAALQGLAERVSGIQ